MADRTYVGGSLSGVSRGLQTCTVRVKKVPVPQKVYIRSSTIQGPNECRESDGEVPRKRRSSSARVTVKCCHGTHEKRM